MSQWIDFKELRSRLRFSEVLAHYGVKLTIKRDQAQGFCPLPTHKGDRQSPSFSANVRRGVWQCFGCGAKGNVLDFAICMERLSPDQAGDVRTVALRLVERLQLDDVVGTRSLSSRKGTGKEEVQREAPAIEAPLFETSTTQKPSSTHLVKVNEPLDFELKGLQPDHSYLTRRGFSEKSIRHFGLGYCVRGLMAGRIAIPIEDTEGRLVGYAGRIVDDSLINEKVPKYKFPSKRERNGITHEFQKSQVVYNAHRIRGTVDSLVVVEGFPSVWLLHQAGIENTVALMGWSCSPEQARILVAKTSPSGRILVFPDGDEAGERCAHGVFAALGAQRWVRWIRLTDGRQPTDCNSDELTRLFGGQ